MLCGVVSFATEIAAMITNADGGSATLHSEQLAAAYLGNEMGSALRLRTFMVPVRKWMKML